MKLWKFECVEMKVTVLQVGPGYVLLFAESSFGSMVFLQTLTPVEPLVQKLSHYFYGPRHLAWLVKFTIIAESINVSVLIFYVLK
jgi:cholesterol 7-desaturase